jgi:hypothetical protein
VHNVELPDSDFLAKDQIRWGGDETDAAKHRPVVIDLRLGEDEILAVIGSCLDRGPRRYGSRAVVCYKSLADGEWIYITGCWLRIEWGGALPRIGQVYLLGRDQPTGAVLVFKPRDDGKVHIIHEGRPQSEPLPTG